MSDKKTRRCMRASFTYADDSKNAHRLMINHECWAGTMIMGRLIDSMNEMNKGCGFSIDESVIREAEEMKEMFERHEPADKLSYKEYARLDAVLIDIEEKVKIELWRGD